MTRRSLGCAVLLATALAIAGCSSDDDDLCPNDFYNCLGYLSVTTVTTGDNPDPDGYTLRIVGPSLQVDRAIGVDETVVYETVQTGIYQIDLDGLADNCAANETHRSVPVAQFETVRVEYEISCP